MTNVCTRGLNRDAWLEILLTDGTTLPLNNWVSLVHDPKAQTITATFYWEDTPEHNLLKCLSGTTVRARLHTVGKPYHFNGVLYVSLIDCAAGDWYSGLAGTVVLDCHDDM